MPVDPRRRRVLDPATSNGDLELEKVPSASSHTHTSPPLPLPPPTSQQQSLPPPLTSSSRSILLQNDDAQDEDEDVDMAIHPELVTATSTTTQPEFLLNNSQSLSDDRSLTNAAHAVTAATSLVEAEEDKHLISRIIKPSPFEQHNSENNRFRTALMRVSQNPTGDAEAWSIIVNEAVSGFRSLIDIHAVDAETSVKLDWIESCYGALLTHFPLATTYVSQVSELLLAQSARCGEENGPFINYYASTGGVSKRALKCEAKLETLLSKTLGVSFVEDQSKKGDSQHSRVENSLCDWCVDLWLLYVRKVTRDATRRSSFVQEGQRDAYIREKVLSAFECAVASAGFGHNNHNLWKSFLSFVKAWTTPGGLTTLTIADHTIQQQQMLKLRSVYQQLISYPMTGLDTFWHEYENFEKSHSEALASALLTELTPKYQHSRTVYLERIRVYGGSDMIQSGGRTLATDPVHHRELKSSFAKSSIQSSSSSEDKNENQDESSAGQMEEEFKQLKQWKIRCAYERTNPERLGPKDLHRRCASAYQEFISTWTRHPESWHMWSMYELHHHKQSLAEVSRSSNDASFATASSMPTGKINRALEVLQLAQTHIPDCTLLAFTASQLVELYSDQPSQCIHVMENFLERSPNTLAFVLCQRMVRRYRGIQAARGIFARARRVLADDPSSTGTSIQTDLLKRKNNVIDASVVSTGGDDDEVNDAVDPSSVETESKVINSKKHWVVANRLTDPLESSQQTFNATGFQQSTKRPPVTWHLYVSHALIEHRVNREPEIAARIYELGLRRHADFLTKTGYVASYAQLLLEQGDSVNLRVLMTRAIAACDDSSVSSSGQESKFRDSSSSLATLWDLYLRFESNLSGGDPLGASRLHEIERKKWQAGMGSDIEDVTTGGLINVSNVALIGAQKSTISEQLVRAEGYDASSTIVSGMSRDIDLLEAIFLPSSFGCTRSDTSRHNHDLEISGGTSDASYHKRLRFQSLAMAGYSAESAMENAMGGGRHLSVRDRLQQGASGSAAGAVGQPTAIMLAIQQSPEWLRPLLLLLPASRLRLPIVAKPPLQITEAALKSLQVNQLPPDRPTDVNESNKRKIDSLAGDSSDEDDVRAGGGYGNLFRDRQRARMMVENVSE